MTMHAQHNPMSYVAREAMEMRDKSGNPAFEKIAMVSMAVVAAAMPQRIFCSNFSRLPNVAMNASMVIAANHSGYTLLLCA